MENEHHKGKYYMRYHTIKDCLDQLESVGYRDCHGHVLTGNVAFQILRNMNDIDIRSGLGEDYGFNNLIYTCSTPSGKDVCIGSMWTKNDMCLGAGVIMVSAIKMDYINQGFFIKSYLVDIIMKWEDGAMRLVSKLTDDYIILHSSELDNDYNMIDMGSGEVSAEGVKSCISGFLRRVLE